MKRRHLAPRSPRQNQRTNAREHRAIHVIPANQGNHANRVSPAKAAGTAANLAMAARVARDAQPTIVVESRPLVVLNQLAEIPKSFARAPKVGAAATVEAAAPAGKRGLPERPAHLGKTDHPAAEAPMQKAVH